MFCDFFYCSFLLCKLTETVDRFLNLITEQTRFGFITKRRTFLTCGNKKLYYLFITICMVSEEVAIEIIKGEIGIF